MDHNQLENASRPSASRNGILDDVLDGMAAAVQAGRAVELEAYAARYPEQAEQISAPRRCIL